MAPVICVPGTANVCLQNLRKTLRYGGRKNVPSVEEVTAVSAGRNSKRQMYRLPGGSETVINTKSTTVVDDIISEMCALINVNNPLEMEEFSLYCIVEGDAFTMPLAREEYILDVTTELQKNQQVRKRLTRPRTQFMARPALRAARFVSRSRNVDSVLVPNTYMYYDDDRSPRLVGNTTIRGTQLRNKNREHKKLANTSSVCCFLLLPIFILVMDSRGEYYL